MIYKNSAPKEAVDVVIFAGHGTSEKDGGYDPGASKNGVNEHELVEYVALEVCNKLSNSGYTVFYDEQNFKDQDLIGVSIKSKFAVSLHANAHNTQARGVEALVPAKEAKLAFEFAVVDRISKLGTPNRGVKSRNYDTGATEQRKNGIASNYKDYYAEIRDAWGRGISLSIIELFFVDNAEDVAFYQANKEKMIDIIVDEMKKLVSPSGAPTTSVPTPTPPKPVEPTPTPAKETIVSRWEEKGQFIADVPEGGVYVRKSPTFTDKDTVMYNNGELCPAKGQYYVECIKTTKYLYIKYKRSNGNWGYVPVREMNTDGTYGEKFGKCF